jgi:CRP-like cAMP-binding protein
MQKPFLAPAPLQKALGEIGSVKIFKPDAVLFKQGDPAKGVYLIQAGKVALTLAKGKTRKAFWIAETGSVLGLPSTVRNLPYSLMAKAIEDTTVIFVSRTKMQRLLLSDPNLCFKAVQILGAEVRSVRLSI